MENASNQAEPLSTFYSRAHALVGLKSDKHVQRRAPTTTNMATSITTLQVDVLNKSIHQSTTCHA